MKPFAKAPVAPACPACGGPLTPAHAPCRQCGEVWPQVVHELPARRPETFPAACPDCGGDLYRIESAAGAEYVCLDCPLPARLTPRGRKVTA